MPSFTEIDTQWDDAGNVTDWPAGRADCAGRCQGGGWSGCTVRVAGPL
jgi:adenylosuccinate synthase